MTATTTASKASSDGKKTAATPIATAGPCRGINRVREEECYYLTGLSQECLREAWNLIYEVHAATIETGSKEIGKPVDYKAISALLREVYECGSKALAYIHQARAALPIPDDETPF